MPSHDPDTSPRTALSLDPEDWAAFRARAHAMLEAAIDKMATAREGRVWTPFPDEVRARFALEETGLSPDEVVGQPQVVSTGLPFCITVLRDHGALRAAKLDVGALRDLAEASGYDGTDMAEPFLVTLKGATGAGDTFSRLLLAPPSPA